MRTTIIALTLFCLFTLAQAEDQPRWILVDEQNYQPSHFSGLSAQKYADLNLKIEIEILKMRRDYRVIVAPYDGGYRVIWLARPGVGIPADSSATIAELITTELIGAKAK